MTNLRYGSYHSSFRDLNLGLWGPRRRVIDTLKPVSLNKLETEDVDDLPLLLWTRWTRIVFQQP